MPWMWDADRYGPGKEDMIGFFYQDDLENIKQLDTYERQRKNKQQ